MTGSATAEWASSVCSDFTAWKTALQEAKSTLSGGSITSADLKAAGNEIKGATRMLAQSLGTLGALETTGGEEAKQDLKNLETSLSFSINKIKDTLNQKASTPAEVAAEITTVKQADATMVAALGTAVTKLKEFDPSGELEQAFKNAPACAPYF